MSASAQCAATPATGEGLWRPATDPGGSEDLFKGPPLRDLRLVPPWLRGVTVSHDTDERTRAPRREPDPGVPAGRPRGGAPGAQGPVGGGGRVRGGRGGVDGR